MPNPNGRPPKLTPKIMDDIRLVIRTGNYVEIAALYAGIHKVTLYRWLKIGAQARTKQPGERTAHERSCMEFCDAVGQAMADSEAESVGRLLRAGTTPLTRRTTTTTTTEDGKVTTVEREEEVPPDWRALAWHLERRHRKHWGQKGSLELSGPEEAPVPVEVRMAEVRRRVRLLRGEADPDQPTEVPDDEATEALSS